ncbi:MAG: chorismate synthase [Spirochaetia bacterium]|nr:chorismate synthase [Spirochaetia bacterium]MBP5739691.1 chorismate synthase [Spirochaetia bacterium]
MSFDIGKNIHLTIFGQSHSKAIGAVIEGLPAGFRIDMRALKAFMARRAPGQKGTTARKEADRPIILSGLVDGITCGSPLAMMIENTDARSKDYEQFRAVPRPMHADYPAFVKYGGFNDIAGGGHFSGRLTAPLCFAGGVCLQYLGQKGIEIKAKLASAGGVSGKKMQECLEEARKSGDSVGGIVECCITGVPAGVGDSGFDSLESSLARILFSIPGVKGVDFGAGFASAAMKGSAHNDAWCFDEKGNVKTKSNNHGGILGGLSTGMPITFRVAFKPTPSIALPQESVDLKSGKSTMLEIKGRHDPCIAVRAVPCVEAAAALVLCDYML